MGGVVGTVAERCNGRGEPDKNCVHLEVGGWGVEAVGFMVQWLRDIIVIE